MEEYKPMSKTKNFIGVGLMIGALGLLAVRGNIENRQLSQTDFENSEWVEYSMDSVRTVWDAYISEDIPHNKFNWEKYKLEVELKNGMSDFSKLEGNFLFPDLDGNGAISEH